MNWMTVGKVIVAANNALWSRSTSPTVPTRSLSLLLLGSGSNREIHMDFPLMTTGS